MKKERPGVVFYFDAIPLLEGLPDDQVGQLFRAGMLYGRTGIEPDFRDPVILMVWNFLKVQIDKDGQKYESKCIAASYGPYKREADKRGRTAVSLECWVDLTEFERHALMQELLNGIA